MSKSATSMSVMAVTALRMRREKLGFTQMQLADRLRCSREHFNKIEGGERTVSADKLFVWAEYLGLEIRVLQVTPQDVTA